MELLEALTLGEAWLEVARRILDAGDDASPWLALKVVIRRPGAVRTLQLGKQTFRGSALLAVPQGVWTATLFASDSSGNTTSVALGSLRGHHG